MNEKWRSEVQIQETAVYLRLYGVLDEDNDLVQRGDVANGRRSAIVDSSGIAHINSCGVRDWVTWLDKIAASGAQVILVGCSPAIVQQINLVQNFTARGWVKSFYAPYFCPQCETEKLLLLDARALGAPPLSAPNCRCDECDGAMDFDDLPQSYFAFLEHATGPQGDDGFDALIGQFLLAETLESGSAPAMRDSLPPIPSLRAKSIESSVRIERVDFAAAAAAAADRPMEPVEPAAPVGNSGRLKWLWAGVVLLAAGVTAWLLAGR